MRTVLIKSIPIPPGDEWRTIRGHHVLVETATGHIVPRRIEDSAAADSEAFVEKMRTLAATASSAKLKEIGELARDLATKGVPTQSSRKLLAMEVFGYTPKDKGAAAIANARSFLMACSTPGAAPTPDQIRGAFGGAPVKPAPVVAAAAAVAATGRTPATAATHPVPPDSELGNFKTIEDAEAWASAHHPNTRFDFTDAHINLINPALKEYHALAQQWPEAAAMVQYVGTYKGKGAPRETFRPNSYAHTSTDNRYIGFNPKFWNNPATFLKDKQGDVKEGWHVPNAYGPDSTMAHEFGHVITNWMRAHDDLSVGPAYNMNFSLFHLLTRFQENNDKLRRDVSMYARKSANEGFAEAVSSLRVTPPAEQATYTKRLGALLDAIRAQPLKSESDLHHIDAPADVQQQANAFYRKLSDAANLGYA